MISASDVTPSTCPPPRVAMRGRDLLRELGVSPHRDPALLARRVRVDASRTFRTWLRAGLATLFAAVETREPLLAADAGRRLIGAGPGLTPLGDDYLGGSALAVATLGQAAAFGDPGREHWLRALIPADAGPRTTPVSAELLEMARRGHAPAPVHGILDLSPDGEADLSPRLAELVAVGASSGRGWATAIGATAFLLAARPPRRGLSERRTSDQEARPR